ncbi:MAG: GNAT family N-acetyltransferase, partial [Saprospiraceae bacterium]|nr:GNAT family N-acetyltransferase [Saprospiraceae bacterium]
MPVIQCGDFTLRPWQKGDEEALVRHADNPKIWAFVRDGFPHPYTLEKARDWIAFCNGPEAQHIAFAIDWKREGAIGG